MGYERLPETAPVRDSAHDALDENYDHEYPISFRPVSGEDSSVEPSPRYPTIIPLKDHHDEGGRVFSDYDSGAELLEIENQRQILVQNGVFAQSPDFATFPQHNGHQHQEYSPVSEPGVVQNISVTDMAAPTRVRTPLKAKEPVKSSENGHIVPEQFTPVSSMPQEVMPVLVQTVYSGKQAEDEKAPEQEGSFTVKTNPGSDPNLAQKDTTFSAFSKPVKHSEPEPFSQSEDCVLSHSDYQGFVGSPSDDGGDEFEYDTESSIISVERGFAVVGEPIKPMTALEVVGAIEVFRTVDETETQKSLYSYEVSKGIAGPDGNIMRLKEQSFTFEHRADIEKDPVKESSESQEEVQDEEVQIISDGPKDEHDGYVEDSTGGRKVELDVPGVKGHSDGLKEEVGKEASDYPMEERATDQVAMHFQPVEQQLDTGIVHSQPVHQFDEGAAHYHPVEHFDVSAMHPQPVEHFESDTVFNQPVEQFDERALYYQPVQQSDEPAMSYQPEEHHVEHFDEGPMHYQPVEQLDVSAMQPQPVEHFEKDAVHQHPVKQFDESALHHQPVQQSGEHAMSYQPEEHSDDGAVHYQPVAQFDKSVPYYQPQEQFELELPYDSGGEELSEREGLQRQIESLSELLSEKKMELQGFKDEYPWLERLMRHPKEGKAGYDEGQIIGLMEVYRQIEDELLELMNIYKETKDQLSYYDSMGVGRS